MMSQYNRRYLPIHPKPPPLNQSLPFRNNDTRLKQIYQAQITFKNKPQSSLKKQSTPPQPNHTHHKYITPLHNRPQHQPKPVNQTQHVHPQHLHHLNLEQLRPHRHHQERDRQSDSVQVYLSHEKGRNRYSKERESHVMPKTSRRDQSIAGPVEKNQTSRTMARRKSISGNLRKKVREQAVHHLSSASPAQPLSINYHQQGKRLYKDGKVTQALRLFQLGIEKNPSLADNFYYAGLCELSKHHYQRGYDHMQHILAHFPEQAKKTVYLFAAIAAKHTEQLGTALTLATSGISKHPQYIDLYEYRAKLNQQQGKWQEAQEDYEVVLKQRKNNAQVLLGAAICSKHLGSHSNSMSLLNAALYADQNQVFTSTILLQRIKINYEAGRLKQCGKDLKKLGEVDPESCDYNYYRGLLLLKERNKKAALLSFEKCLRNSNGSESVVESLIEITRSKIDDRDFYSALYHINRSTFLQLTSPKIEQFRLFAEGVVFLMKRKVDKAVQNLMLLQANHSPLDSYFQKLFYLYRAFGHFMQSKHQLAIEDYRMAGRFITIDKHIKYNQEIAEGIVMTAESSFAKALSKFDSAQNTISQGMPSLKIEPLIYRSMTFVQKIKSSHSKNRNNSHHNELQTLQEIFTALKQLDKAYDTNDSNSNMLFLRSLIYMYLGKTEDGLQDIIKAISKSQQNVAKYFFFRALAQQTLGSHKAALNDFNICINLDQKYTQAYFERAKLHFATDQTSKGLQDLNKQKQLNPKSDIKLHECCLFFLMHEYDLAEACLPNIQDQTKRRCLEVLINLKQLRVAEAADRMDSKADKMICQIVEGIYSIEEYPPTDLQFFSRVAYYSYLGIRSFHLGDYKQAVQHFSLAIKEKSLMDLEQNTGSAAEDSEQQDTEIEIKATTHKDEIHYLNFNLMLGYLATGERKKAYQIFLKDIYPAKPYFLKSEEVGVLSRMLIQSMKIKKEEEELIGGDKQVLQVALFRSILGQTADWIDLQLPNFIMRTKLCYLMPDAKWIGREYNAKINPEYILNCLSMSEVQNRPQPPWVRRNNQDLIFTDDIIDIDIEFQTTEQDEDEEDQEEGLQEEDEEMGQSEGQSQEVFDPRSFRDRMRLDDDLQMKLQRIMEKKKEQ